MSSLRSPPWLSPILDRVLALQPSTETGPLLQADGSPRMELTHIDVARPRRLFEVPATPGVAPRSHLNGLCDDLRSVVSPRPRMAQCETLRGHAEHRNEEGTWPVGCSDMLTSEPGTGAFGVLSDPPTMSTPVPSQEFISVSNSPLPRSARARSACFTCSVSGVLSGSRRVASACAVAPGCLWRYTTALTYLNLSCVANSLRRQPCVRKRPAGSGGNGRAESTLGGAADEFLRRGGALQLLYWYNAVAVALCCILAFLALCVEVWRALDAVCRPSSAIIDGGKSDVGPDGGSAFSALSPYVAPWCSAISGASSSSSSSSSAASPKLPPLFWPSLFWLRTLYGLSGAPYVAFKLPLVARLYLTPHATGYDRQGRTVPQRVELRGRAAPPRDEEHPREALDPGAAVA